MKRTYAYDWSGDTVVFDLSSNPPDPGANAASAGLTRGKIAVSEIDDEGKNLKSALTDPIREDLIADNLIQRRFVADNAGCQASTVSNLPTINANRRQLGWFTIRCSVTSRAVGSEYRRLD